MVLPHSAEFRYVFGATRDFTNLCPNHFGDILRKVYDNVHKAKHMYQRAKIEHKRIRNDLEDARNSFIDPLVTFNKAYSVYLMMRMHSNHVHIIWTRWLITCSSIVSSLPLHSNVEYSVYNFWIYTEYIALSLSQLCWMIWNVNWITYVTRKLNTRNRTSTNASKLINNWNSLQNHLKNLISSNCSS